MNKEYLIVDPRPLEAFKDKTFSGFKKREVINALLKGIETSKIENVCYWITECIISGYIFEIIEKLLISSSKLIHINSPNLPVYLLKKYSTFLKSINHIKKNEKEKYIHLRNTQSIRHFLFDIAVTIASSPKNKRYDKYPKINEKEDFLFFKIKEKMNATMQILPSTTIRFTDPDELRVIMNEFFFNVKNNLGGYEKASYWVSWLIHWEKKNKANKQCFEIEERTLEGVPPKYSKNIIWLIWEVIFEETRLRDEKIQKQIQALYKLFIHDYRPGKRNTRLPYVYHSIGYLTLPLNLKVPIVNDLNLFLQTQCNINLMFQKKKEKEIKDYHSPPKLRKKIGGIQQEICNDQMNVLNEMDQILLERK